MRVGAAGTTRLVKVRRVAETIGLARFAEDDPRPRDIAIGFGFMSFVLAMLDGDFSVRGFAGAVVLVAAGGLAALATFVGVRRFTRRAG